jgi:predicted esterase
MKKKMVIALCCTFLALTGKTQQTAEKFIQASNYLLYLPDGYSIDTAKKWPFLLFLHGSGECGDDINKVKVNGPPKLVAQGRKFPFIIVSPQAASYVAGFQVETLNGLLLELKQTYRVDPDRIYLTGLSMGGFSTWDLAEKHPEEFAAIAPICSGGPLENIWELRHTPVWCFHGAKDDNVPVSDSRRMVDSLKHYSSNVRLTIYPNANHDSWDTTYNDDSVYRWLLAQKKFNYTPVALSVTQLEQYAGVYKGPFGSDTIRVADGKLMSTIRTYTTPYVPETDSSFFNVYNTEITVEIVFFKDKRGKPIGFWCYDPVNRNLFTRVADAVKQ